jgi:hypothetical protein
MMNAKIVYNRIELKCNILSFQAVGRQVSPPGLDKCVILIVLKLSGKRVYPAVYL